LTASEPNPKSWIPRLGAAITALVGLVNIASALTPNIRWRGHLLLQFEAVETMRVFHALALPAGAALLLVAPYLLKRRRRALQAAIVVMLALGVVNLLKGLDWEEAILSCVSAAMLYHGRAAFQVAHEPISLRSAVWRVPLLGALGLAVVGSPPGPQRDTRRSPRWPGRPGTSCASVTARCGSSGTPLRRSTIM
jgi:lysylphosphatidylglycerol synthetase-like protein (DUF2156 family)